MVIVRKRHSAVVPRESFYVYIKKVDTEAPEWANTSFTLERDKSMLLDINTANFIVDKFNKNSGTVKGDELYQIEEITDDRGFFIGRDFGF